jgi:hypothetical protein
VFHPSKLRELFEYILSLRNPHRKKSGGVRSGDRDGRRPRPTFRSPMNSFGKAVVFTVWAVSSTLRSVSSVHTVRRRACSCRKHFLCSEMLLPVGVLLSYSVLLCQDTHCYILHEQQQTFSMRINFRERTHVLLVNIPCL